MRWEEVKLEDISTNIQTGPFGSQLHQYDYSETGTPVVMPKDLTNGVISEQSIARVSEDHVQRLNRHMIQKGDILYSRRGDVGRCALATEHEVGWLCGTGCLRITIDETIADSKFVFYQLQQEKIVGWVEKHAVGATMLNLNTTILSNIPLHLPPLETQRRIADILSAYDDLIENNRKQIKLLEEAAQRLYKEWFVDLRFPGHEHTQIVDGVPEGWEKKQLSDIVEVKYGKDHKSIPDGNVPVYGSGGLMRKCNQMLYKGESVLIPRKGSLNNFIYVDEAFWTVDTMFYTKMKWPNIGVFIYYFIKSFDMYAMNIGAAVPSMTTNTLNSINVIIPSCEILKNFQSTTKVYFRKIELLKRQIEMAAQARDRLLPKLMSGEVEE